MVELIYKNDYFYIKKQNTLGHIYNDESIRNKFKNIEDILNCDYIIFEPGFDIKNYIVIHKEDNFIFLQDFINKKLLYPQNKLENIINKKLKGIKQ